MISRLDLGMQMDNLGVCFVITSVQVISFSKASSDSLQKNKRPLFLKLRGQLSKYTSPKSHPLPPIRHQYLNLIQQILPISKLIFPLPQPMSRPLMIRSSNPMSNLTFPLILTNLLPVQSVKLWSQWSADIVILSSEFVLTMISRWICFVAPMAREVEPGCWRVGI